MIFRSFATFFGPTVFTSGAKQKLLFPQSISVLDQNAINDSPDYPAEGQLNSELIYEVIVSPKMPNKNLKDFCLGRIGQKSFKFLVGIFGERMTS